MYEMLKTLCELPGAVGSERLVQETLQERWNARCEKSYLDGAGNLIVHVGGRGKNLVITAHADETSFFIKSISDDGFVFLNCNQSPLRPQPYLHFIGQPALALGREGQKVEGVFATATGHVTTAVQRERSQLEWNDVFIDIGATSIAEVKARGLDIGCPVVWNPPTRRSGKYIWGKAMDDRIGLAVMDALLIELDPRSLRHNLYLVSTVQEELGMVGAGAVPRQVPADQVICIDIGPAGDVPTVQPRDIPVKLGAGPVLVWKDNLVHYNSSLTLSLQRLAEKSGIPIQSAVYPSYASDGLEFIKAGIETALVAPPTRYTHSPFEMIHEDDLVSTVGLLNAFLQTGLS